MPLSLSLCAYPVMHLLYAGSSPQIVVWSSALTASHPQQKKPNQPFECIWPKTSTSTWLRRQRNLPCGKSYMPFTKNNPHRNSYWSNNCSIWRWESPIWQLPTLTPSVLSYPNSPPKGSTSKKNWKPLPYSRAYWRVGRYFAWLSSTAVQSWIWTKWSDKSSLRIFDDNWWASLSMTRQKPTTRPSRTIGSTDWENKPREPV